MTFQVTLWTLDRVDNLRGMLARNMAVNDMAARLDLTRRQLQVYLRQRHPSYLLRRRVGGDGVSAQLIAERDRRAAVERDITGALMGDPPNGYSALDRKREAPMKTDADFDDVLDRYAKFKREVFDRIPKQAKARGPVQDEAVLSEPEEQAAARLIESGRRLP